MWNLFKKKEDSRKTEGAVINVIVLITDEDGNTYKTVLEDSTVDGIVQLIVKLEGRLRMIDCPIEIMEFDKEEGIVRVNPHIPITDKISE